MEVVALFTILFMLFAVGVVLALGAAWIYTLVDALTRDFDGDNDKLLWVLVILFAGIIGSIIYYFVVLNDATDKDEEEP